MGLSCNLKQAQETRPKLGGDNNSSGKEVKGEAKEAGWGSTCMAVRDAHFIEPKHTKSSLPLVKRHHLMNRRGLRDEAGILISG